MNEDFIKQKQAAIDLLHDSYEGKADTAGGHRPATA